ncbi:helix-turn-helix domain-containing protein [Modestobacter sp. SSW1-42]|uniref:helix-turn-helix domain-containing protein n=1 Tax=Modestobacter sp. SSW1-42 TaxID=596372 RepID=UPI003986775C
MQELPAEPFVHPVRDPNVPYDEDELAGIKSSTESLAEQIRWAIRDHREHLGWSKVRLATELRTLGVDLRDEAIVRIEQGTRAVRAVELWAIAAAFRVEVDALYGDSPPVWSLDERIRQVEAHISWGKNRVAHLIQSTAMAEQEIEDDRKVLARLKRQRDQEVES